MKWLEKLRQYAPDIAMAVASGGATLPQLALKAVADATGSPVGTIEQLGAVVESANPEAMLRVQQANNSFKIRMAELGNELTVTELGDVQHARVQHKHSAMPSAICCAMTVMVSAGAYLLFTVPVPPENAATAYLLFGAVLTKWGDSIAYWVGTTRSSAAKTMMMGGKK